MDGISNSDAWIEPWNLADIMWLLNSSKIIFKYNNQNDFSFSYYVLISMTRLYF
jgi:hypothetical protein